MLTWAAFRSRVQRGSFAATCWALRATCCKSAIKPVWDGKVFAPRLMLPLSLSWDHRVIDGAAAVRFTSFLAAALNGSGPATAAVLATNGNTFLNNGGILNLGVTEDINLNGILDGEDIANLTSADVDLNGIPDECDIARGTSQGCNANKVLRQMRTGRIGAEGAQKWGRRAVWRVAVARLLAGGARWFHLG